MRVAVIQIGIWDRDSEQDRWKQAEAALCRLEREEVKPDFVLLPEMWSCGFFNFGRYRESALRTEAEWRERLCGWSKRLQSYLVTGSLAEEEGGRCYNTTRLYDRSGNLLGSYRKIHLFGYQSDERRILTPGTSLCTAETEFGRVGMATCYDLRFPEQFRLMAEAGVTCLLVVSAWPMARLGHWRLFNQVRALENQCFLFSCNCAGCQAQTAYAGHSMGVAPDGSIICEAGEEPGVFWYDTDPGLVAECRTLFPAWADRINLRDGHYFSI